METLQCYVVMLHSRILFGSRGISCALDFARQYAELNPGHGVRLDILRDAKVVETLDLPAILQKIEYRRSRQHREEDADKKLAPGHSLWRVWFCSHGMSVCVGRSVVAAPQAQLGTGPMLSTNSPPAAIS